MFCRGSVHACGRAGKRAGWQAGGRARERVHAHTRERSRAHVCAGGFSCIFRRCDVAGTFRLRTLLEAYM